MLTIINKLIWDIHKLLAYIRREKFSALRFLNKYNKIEIKYKGYLSFDFDSVIATYKRPFKYDILGKPNKEIIKVMRYYYEKGYHINIFTGRILTPKMKKWLSKYKVPYHTFNVNPKVFDNACRFKPYYDCIIDDKGLNYHFKYNAKSKKQLIKEIDEIIKWSKEGKK